MMASVVVTNITATTVTAEITGLSGDSSGYSNPRITCSNGTTLSGYSVTFTGLTPDTQYAFDGYIFYKDPSDPNDQGNDIYISGQYATTLRQRPYDFAWYIGKVSGGIFNVSAVEWRDFCSRINAFRYYKYMSPYSFTNVQGISEVGEANATPFYSNIFNEAIYAIQPMAAVDVPIVKADDDIYASYLNGLVDCLNSIS